MASHSARLIGTETEGKYFRDICEVRFDWRGEQWREIRVERLLIIAGQGTGACTVLTSHHWLRH